MGGSISKRKAFWAKPSREQRVEYLKKTPFFIYLHGRTLDEFASCFSTFQIIDANDSLPLDKEIVYIVAEGELELRTTIPHANSKIENEGYLCKKAVGDIVSKSQAQSQVARKVSKDNEKTVDVNGLLTSVVQSFHLKTGS